jgi:hypothetical protein
MAIFIGINLGWRVVPVIVPVRVDGLAATS